MKLIEITKHLEKYAPLKYQESYDNCGLQIGDFNMEVKGALICMDITLQTVEECIKLNYNLIISHHPFLFNSIKKIDTSTQQGKIIDLAVKNNIAIYSIHTNIDNQFEGLNKKLCETLDLQPLSVLQPTYETIAKLAVYCPNSASQKVRNALFEAGAGFIGNYDSCSFNVSGTGTYKPLEGSNPFVGEIDKMHLEPEEKIEVIFPIHLKEKIISELLKNHPYEEVAYDILPLLNENKKIGAGMISVCKEPIMLFDFFRKIKNNLNLPVVRHNATTDKLISKVALCGGAGSFLINNAISQKADLFISSDFKYHEFFTDQNVLVIADIGHFESENIITKWIFDVIKEKFHNFAVQIISVQSNPVKYF